MVRAWFRIILIRCASSVPTQQTLHFLNASKANKEGHLLKRLKLVSPACQWRRISTARIQPVFDPGQCLDIAHGAAQSIFRGRCARKSMAAVVRSTADARLGRPSRPFVPVASCLPQPLCRSAPARSLHAPRLEAACRFLGCWALAADINKPAALPLLPGH